VVATWNSFLSKSSQGIFIPTQGLSSDFQENHSQRRHKALVNLSRSGRLAPLEILVWKLVAS
jgi:predicted extracellular nuclease